MGWLLQDVDEANQAKQLEKMYWAFSNKLQVPITAMLTLPECWVDVPSLVAWAQLLVDIHDSLGHCG